MSYLLIGDLVMSAIVAGIASLIGGAISYFGQRKQSKEAKQLNEENNQFNQQQVEDARLFQSYDQLFKRADAAGVSRWAALGQQSSTPIFQANASPASDSGLGALGSMVQQLGKSVVNAHDRYLDEKQREFDRQMKEESLKFQKAQLEALQMYRREVLDNQKWQFGLKQAFQQDVFNFKKQFYEDPKYLGYWQTRNSQINAEFADATNPIRIQMLKNQQQISAAEARYRAEYLRARNISALANSRYAKDRALMYHTLYNDELAYRQMLYRSALSDPGNTKVGQWMKFSMGLLEDVAGFALPFTKFRKFIPPTPSNGYTSSFNPFNSGYSSFSY